MELDGKELEARGSLVKEVPGVRLVHRQATMVAAVVELAERLIVLGRWPRNCEFNFRHYCLLRRWRFSWN